MPQTFEESIEQPSKAPIRRDTFLNNDNQDEDPLHGFKLLVVGCGRAGGGMVNTIYHRNIPGIVTLAIDTDREALDASYANHSILIGKSLTNGRGAAGSVDIGRQAVKLSYPTIRQFLSKNDIIFLCAGLGGGTGTGAIPLIATLAKEEGALVIAVVTLPLSVERLRISKAAEGLCKLIPCVDTVIVLDNNQVPARGFPPFLFDRYIPWMGSIGDIIEDGIIRQVQHYQFEWETFQRIFSQHTIAVLLTGESKSSNKAESVVRNCLSNVSYTIDYRKAAGSFLVMYGDGLTFGEANEIALSLTYDLPSHADILYYNGNKPMPEDVVRVICVMTGIRPHQK